MDYTCSLVPEGELVSVISDAWPSQWLIASYFIVATVLIILLVLVQSNTIDQIAGFCILLTPPRPHGRFLSFHLDGTKFSQMLISIIGNAQVFRSSPLGAELSRAVASIEKQTPGIFGKAGASGHLFPLYTSESAAEVLAGPAWIGFAFGEMG